MDTPDLEIVAINDLMSVENAVCLLTCDSVYGKYEGNVSIHKTHIHVNEKKVLFFQKRILLNCLWKDLDIDVVIESTGLFTKREDVVEEKFRTISLTRRI